MDATAPVQLKTDTGEWITICAYGDLEPARGVAAKLPDGSQAALFRDRDGAVYAVGNLDPFSRAQVIANGITGSVDGAPTVASPMYKHLFDLRTGRCLDEPDNPERALPVHVVRVTPVAAVS
ncbi:nitrite reductase small subunit NirD [Streptomyces celluloflavus]|uniref:Nitrite reductase small subunit NirD n=1 Tax=Streptomyces celluloflavus TaxID=58344 RepID=A0ABW7R7Z1_9ACTN